MSQALIREFIAHQKLLAASPDMNVRDAVQWMVRENRAALIIERDRHMIGIFTENDALGRVLAEGRDPVRTKLHEVMTRNPVTLTADQPLLEAFNTMRQFGFRHVPITDNDHPAGIISLRDFLDLDMNHLNRLMPR